MQRDLSVIDQFAARHIGPSSEDQRAMLATLGYGSLDELIAAALPAGLPRASLAALGAGGCRPPGPSSRPWPNCAGWPPATPCGPP